MTVGPQHEEAFDGGPLYNAVSVSPAAGSIPGMYSLDQDNATAMLKTTYVQNNDKINEPLNSAYGGLRTGIPLPLAIIEAVVQPIIQIIEFPFLTIGHAINAVLTFIGDLLGFLMNPLGLGSGAPDHDTSADNFIEHRIKPRRKLAHLQNGRLEGGQEPQSLVDTWSNFWGSIFGVPGATDKNADDFHDATETLNRRTSNAAKQSETVLSLFNFAGAQSIWGSANPTFETSVALGDLRKPAVSGSAVTTANDPWSTNVTENSSGGAFVRCKQSQDKSVFQWLGKGNTNITGCKLHVWRMTAAGDLTYVQSHSVVPATMPNAVFDFVNVVLDPPVHVEPGDILAGEVCITGTGTHIMAGMDTPWLPNDNTARPKRKGFVRNSGLEAAPPLTILDAAVPYSSETPYVGFGVLLADLPTPKYNYSDTFDGGTMNWSALAGVLNFANGVFNVGASGHNFALFTPATNSDEARVEFDMRAPAWNVLNPSFGGNSSMRAMMHCTPGASQYVGVEVHGGSTPFQALPNVARIVTGTSPTGPVTYRSPGTTVPQGYTGRIALEYDPGTNTYGLFLGTTQTTPFQTWQDTTNIIKHGPGYRQAALYANYASVPPGQPVCDNFSYRDV